MPLRIIFTSRRTREKRRPKKTRMILYTSVLLLFAGFASSQEPLLSPRCHVSAGPFEAYCGQKQTLTSTLQICLQTCSNLPDCYIANWYPETDTCDYFLRTQVNNVCADPVTALGAKTIRCYFDENTLKDCLKVDTSPVDCSGRDSLTSYRTFDGTCNNIQKPRQGAAHTPVARLLPAHYYDMERKDTPYGFPGEAGWGKAPTATEVATGVLGAAPDSTEGGAKSELCVLHMTFGQFYDHDIALSESSGECNDMRNCDSMEAFKYPCFPILKSRKNLGECAGFTRTHPVCQEGGSRGPREHVNELTPYIDLSQMYGTSEKEANGLRAHYDGLMRTFGADPDPSRDLLPADPANVGPCNEREGGCFIAGDIRVNENVALASMHTLWVREHNRVAMVLRQLNGHWNDEKLFQEARKITTAVYQNIIVYEWAATLVKMDPYQGYSEDVSTQITNAFSTAAFRFAHSEIPNKLSQLNPGFNPIIDDVPLQMSFMNNTLIERFGIEPTLCGLVGNATRKVDRFFADGVFTKLFVPLGSILFRNLAALNIQRGRDHGLPSYQQFREFCGLPRAERFTDLNNIPKTGRTRLRKMYGSMENHIDLFPAGLLEKHPVGLHVGETFGCIIKKHYEAARSGDRYFFENPGVFTAAQVASIKKVTMSSILCNNMKDVVSIQEKAFFAYDRENDSKNSRVTCDRIPNIDLNLWKE